MSVSNSSLQRWCASAAAVVLLAACGQLGLPSSGTPTPDSALATVSAAYPVLSPANVASLVGLTSLQISPAAHVACAAQGNVLAVGDPKTIAVYPTTTLAVARTIQANNPLSLLAVSPDGQRIASADAGGQFQVWDTATGKAVRYFKIELVQNGTIPEIGMYTVDVQYGPGHWLAIGAGAKAYFLQGDTGQIKQVFGGAQSQGSYVAISPDGQMVALANEVKGSISIWRTSDGQLAKQLKDPTGDWLTGLAFRGDGKTLVADHASGFDVWDIGSGQLVSTLAETGVQKFTVSSDGALLFGALGNQVAVWDLSTGHRLTTSNASPDPILVLQTCLGGRLLLTESQTGAVVVWGAK
jgi:WD40 repeat protein